MWEERVKQDQEMTLSQDLNSGHLKSVAHKAVLTLRC